MPWLVAPQGITHLRFFISELTWMATFDLPEMALLERIVEESQSLLSVRNIRDVAAYGHRFPIYAISLGDSASDLPVVGFFGGIHGLERIGTQVLLAYLRSLLARLRWDRALREHLNSVRLVFMPIVNPAGMWHATRSNAHGVDLMRNAPVVSLEKVPFLIGGQRLSPRLPWFRGTESDSMESENQAVCQVVHEDLLSHEFSLALDCHSGFGVRDRIWFPYAYTTSPIRHLPEILALEELFQESYPNHNYLFEPQSKSYLTHGDLWDYLHRQLPENSSRIFLPLTLEMGSWLWIRKSPLQMFSRIGLFNPLPQHRLKRVLRRHLYWLEFLVLAACGYKEWVPTGAARAATQERALARWYGGLRR